jgi:hypothetical protein
MPYTPFYTTWEDTPSTQTPITSDALNYMEAGIAAAAATADAAIPKAISGVATDKVPVYNGSAWVAHKIVDAQIDAAAAISRSKLATLPAARVYRTTAQTIATGTVTAVSFDGETFDIGGMHEGVTNPSRLTVSEAGIYIVTGTLELTTASSAGSYRTISLRVNGSYVIADVAGTLSTFNRLGVAVVHQFSASDYVELVVFHDQGTNGTVVKQDFFSPYLSMARVS